MKTCPSCGLPDAICSALAAYNRAIILFQDGDLIEANKHAIVASLFFVEYMNERTSDERENDDSMRRH